jgi:hypothetical protein
MEDSRNEPRDRSIAKSLQKPTEMTHDKETYRRIRKAIGFLGIGLPLVLVILSLVPFFKTAVQPSISAYYYTNLREIFTGSLCAVGLFLIRYVGYKSSSFWKNDNLLTNLAGYMAFGIALFPTNPDNWDEKVFTLIPLNAPVLGAFHYAFAAVFFSILAIMSIKIFTIGQAQNDQIPLSPINENHIYKICGYLILLFIILIPVFSILHIFPYSTLMFEALALFSFGISWLVKGRVLGDKGKIGERIYRESN